MGRRRRYAEPPKLYNDAFPLIDKLEMAVITRVVEADFTVDQALYALYEDDTVNKLKAAWPLTRDGDRGSYINERVIIPAAGATAVTATVIVHAKAAQILVPEAGNAKMERVLAYEPLVRAIQEAHEQHLRFEKLRAAVRWLNLYATPGAARHYCPWMTAILPADHAFQKLDGVIYREPECGIGEIMSTMRECAAIMASALLVGDLDHSSDKNRLRLSFQGRRDNDGYASQKFGLI